jgi:hypothetical protein
LNLHLQQVHLVVRIKCAFFGVRICIVYAFYKLDMHFIN